MSRKFMKKKKMRYARYTQNENNNARVLYAGTLKGYQIMIIDMCHSHPCIYVKVPRNMSGYIETNLCCHGGVSYVGYMISDPGEGYEWIGWDYMHLCDYKPRYRGIPYSFFSRRKWTTEELYLEARDAVKHLRKLVKEYNGK